MMVGLSGQHVQLFPQRMLSHVYVQPMTQPISAVCIVCHGYKHLEEPDFGLFSLAGILRIFFKCSQRKPSQPRRCCCCCSPGRWQQSRRDSDVLYLPAAE